MAAGSRRSPQTPPARGDWLKQLDGLFQEWNRSDAPGLAVGIYLGGKVIYRQCFGLASIESGVAIDSRTRMRIASTTKHFTAMLALLLQQDGVLDVDAPISRYLPELRGENGQTSIRLLLQHRSGVRCYLDLGFLTRGLAVPPKGTALATQFRQEDLNFPSGSQMIYSNGGYQLVSAAIERAAGRCFEKLLFERIFEPLRMLDTSSVPSDMLLLSNAATMHVADQHGCWRRGIFPTEELRGEGAIISTLDDMLRWIHEFFSRDTVTSERLWSVLLEQPAYADGSTGNYALGMMFDEYRGLRIIHHAGGVFGGLSQLLLIPDENAGVVILANGAKDADPVKLALRIVDILFADQLLEPAPLVVTTERPEIIGDWYSPETGMLYTFCDVDGALHMSICGNTQKLPVRQGADGAAFVRPGSLGDLFISFPSAPSSDSISIKSGELAALYCKLPAVETLADLVGRFRGRFESSEAGCAATLDGKGGVTFHDPHGEVSLDVRPVSNDVACLRSRNHLLPIHAAITLEQGTGRVTGFRLNTARTRNLAFRGAEDAGAGLFKNA